MKKKIFTYVFICLLGFLYSVNVVKATTEDDVQPSPEPLNTSDWFIGRSEDPNEKIVGFAGSEISLKLYSGEINVDEITQEWKSSDEEVAKVDENGKVQCLSMDSEGTEITNTISINGEALTILRCVIYISDPELSYDSVKLKKNERIGSLLAGLTEFSTVTYTSGNAKAVRVEGDGELVGVNYGKSVITIIADGKKMNLTVLVSDPKLNTYWFLSTKGKSKQLTIKNISGATSVVYKSSNTQVATVSKAGKIKAKKIGNANITISVDNVNIVCVVNITYTKALKVIRSAEKVLGKRYSQARRMQKNYYDCSSLVWRMYKKQKVYFGIKSHAPVAAAEAKYMVNKKKALSYKYMSAGKLLPGDLIFVKGKYNGRYRNICHVAIYIGNGRIIHATGTHVQYGYYDTYKGRIAVIARPLK